MRGGVAGIGLMARKTTSARTAASGISGPTACGPPLSGDREGGGSTLERDLRRGPRRGALSERAEPSPMGAMNVETRRKKRSGLVVRGGVPRHPEEGSQRPRGDRDEELLAACLAELKAQRDGGHAPRATPVAREARKRAAVEADEARRFSSRRRGEGNDARCREGEAR